MEEVDLSATAGDNEEPIDTRPPTHEDHMTFGEVAEMLDLRGETTEEDIEKAGPYRQPSPRLGRLILEHGIETVIVPLGEGKLGRALSPGDVNHLFDIVNSPKS